MTLMSATTSQPSAGDWLAHKDLIRHEYLVKGTKLKELAIMLKSKGLHVSFVYVSRVLRENF